MPRESREPSERASRIEPLTRLATGGMADIWLAREVGTAGMERFVVVKRLLPHLARDPEIVDMFVSEGRFVARLTHPNVVQIHDIAQDEEGYFLVMEYVAGCSASELLTAAAQANARLPLSTALTIAEQACRGAHAAHELCSPAGDPLGLVHRDISPHNLMIGPSGEVKLLDFGIAKATATIDATRAGSVKGKQGYMSPEQCAGGHVDRRSDVFALGIVTWELFTGTRLFKRETDYATMHAIVSGDVRAAASARSDVPPEVDDVLRKALATDVEARFQTADALRRDLVAALEKAGIRASRDDLLTTMTELLGPRLAERERALREAAKTGAKLEPHALRAALVQPETSTPGPRNLTPDGVATVVQRKPAHLPEDAPDDEPRAVSATTNPSNDREATLLDARPAPPKTIPKEHEEATDPRGPSIEEAAREEGRDEAPRADRDDTSTRDRDDASRSDRDKPSQNEADRARGSGPQIRLIALLAIVMAAVVAAVSALRGRDGSSASSPSSAAPAAPTGPKLRFVAAPTVAPEVLQNELAPFLGWLTRELGRPVDLLLADTYDHTGQMVADGRADFALMPPLLFVRALAADPKLQPLAVRLFDGSRASDGYLLVRDETPLTQAADLKGHTICYVDQASTTGYLLPRIWMRNANVDPEKDVKSVVSGDHVAAMRDLSSGKCDAAAVYSGAFLTARQQGIAVGRLRVLAITGRVPQDALVASPTMPTAEVDALKAALLRFDPQRDIDAGRIGDVLAITGFAEFRWTEFDSIREAAEREGLVKKRP